MEQFPHCGSLRRLKASLAALPVSEGGSRLLAGEEVVVLTPARPPPPPAKLAVGMDKIADTQRKVTPSSVLVVATSESSKLSVIAETPDSSQGENMATVSSHSPLSNLKVQQVKYRLLLIIWGGIGIYNCYWIMPPECPRH